MEDFKQFCESRSTEIRAQVAQIEEIVMGGTTFFNLEVNDRDNHWKPIGTWNTLVAAEATMHKRYNSDGKYQDKPMRVLEVVGVVASIGTPNLKY